MASSSYCFGVVSLVVLLQFLFVSPSASTKFIDAICQQGEVPDKDFCTKTLNASSVATAFSEFEAAMAAIRLVAFHVEKVLAFTKDAAKENPKQFLESQNAFALILKELTDAASYLKGRPEYAYYFAMMCTDNTKLVKYYIGKNTDKTSEAIISMTLVLEKFIGIAIGATLAVGG